MQSNSDFRFEEFFFCSVVGIFLLYQNPLHVSSIETLILIHNFETTPQP
jgi:hypothetical protein